MMQDPYCPEAERDSGDRSETLCRGDRLNDALGVDGWSIRGGWEAVVDMLLDRLDDAERLSAGWADEWSKAVRLASDTESHCERLRQMEDMADAALAGAGWVRSNGMQSPAWVADGIQHIAEGRDHMEACILKALDVLEDDDAFSESEGRWRVWSTLARPLLGSRHFDFEGKGCGHGA